MKRTVFGSVHAKITQNLGNKNLTLQTVPLKKLLYISLAISIISIIFVLLVSNRLPPEIPLFYGLPQGEEQITSKSTLISTGIFALAVVVINLIIVRYIKNDFLKKALIIAGFSVSFLSFFTTCQIIFLVGSI